jgi:transposase
LPESLFYVGIDWATEMHAVCELDSAGKIKSQFMIAHTADGLADLLRRLGKLPADPMDVPVAIERPDGRLVDALLEAGHPVMPVSPNALKTWREGQVLSGAKSDAGDAAVIATRRRAAAPTAIRPGRTNENTLIDAVGDAVLALVTVVKALGAARKDLHRSVAAHLGEHPDGPISTSLPRSGQINAAQMLAEGGDSRAAYDRPDAMAALAGMTPVTSQSGKHGAVYFRWACNKRFRKAVSTFADNSRHASPWAHKIYTDAIARGHHHPHAVRVLARAWIRVIYRCWLDGVPYDPDRHGNAIKLHRPNAARG